MNRVYVCDDPLCMSEAVARMYVCRRRLGVVVKSCNVCEKHGEMVRAAAHQGSRYVLREGPPCERAAASRRFVLAGMRGTVKGGA